MPKRIFTKSQQSAIDTRDKTLLVSAAAGSGKTATLIERIVQAILDKKNPTDINRMLIVTFTKAAAAELRIKIDTALREKLQEEPENSRLEKQLYLLAGANISTIDAFCNGILKTNTERFGISPKYRIADPIEAKILSHTVWSALIEAAYSGELSDSVTAEEFSELASTLTAVKNNSALEEVFDMLYEHSKSHEEGVSIFRAFASSLEASASSPLRESEYMEFALRRVHEIAVHYKSLTGTLLMKFSEEPCGVRMLTWYSEQLEKIVLFDDYTEIRAALPSLFESNSFTRKNGAVEPEIIQHRDAIKAAFKDCYNDYFINTEEEWLKKAKKLSSLLFTIASFIEAFDSAYFEEKRARAILEYSDIERLTYKSLYNSDGTLTDFAMSVRHEFDAVYIDEYQDVNSLQNRIFDAISTDTNRFMVGDIKQSIYVFRNARPDIFADMKNAFPPLSAAESSSSASIFMSENFRCDEAIINFVNSVFDNVFTLFGESIEYTPSDRLKYAKIQATLSERSIPELHIFTSEDEEREGEEFEDENSIANDPSPTWVANKIKELISHGRLNSGEPVRASDIAIILRKDMGRSRVYADALMNLGISARAPDDKSFFLNSEIQLALCLLNTIDNPRRDIYLAGLMLSPLYSFTPDELYLIRRFGGSGSLWQALTKYCADNPEFEKGISFINTVKHYREISEGIKTDAFILRLYRETGLLALAKRDGKEENLMLLYNYARKFEFSSFEGLYNFINYINEVIDSNSSFASAASDNGEDAVTIITAHKSKGLEYPIVFAADAQISLVSSFERKVKVSYSDKYGIGMKTRSKNGYALVENPIHKIIIKSNIEKSIEEELRVYYVALTRARERLFVVGKLGISKEKYLERLYMKKLMPSRQTLWELSHLIDIIMLSNPDAGIVFENSAQIKAEKEEAESDKAAKSTDLANTDELYSTIYKRFSFKYPDAYMTLLPEKMSVSRLYPAVLDELDGELSVSLDQKKSKPEGRLGILPEFISGAREEESARRGIATHTFLQFFDIESFDKKTPEQELERLTQKEYISKENAARVRLNEISLFKKSKLLCEMKQAVRLWREFRFSVMLPASYFTESEEKKAAYRNSKILLQGVIDCLIEDADGNLHLIDYKTDRLSKEELVDKSLAEQTLSQKHSLQLSYYSLAVEKIFGKRPKSTRVYSLPLGDTVNVCQNTALY